MKHSSRKGKWLHQKFQLVDVHGNVEDVLWEGLVHGV